jgi:hypothetical protein
MPFCIPEGADFLPPGPHTATVEEIKSALVDPFEESNTRPDIHAQWLALRDRVANVISLERQWLDGSFVSSKRNPRDLDLATFASSEDVEALDPIQEAELNALTGSTSGLDLLDSFLIVEYPERHPMHAIGVEIREAFASDFFGRDSRSGTEKGFAQVES